MLVLCLLVCVTSIRPSHSFLPAPTTQHNHAGRLRSLPPKLESLVTDALDTDRKIVVVTGGVLSGIGKGVTASSIGVVSNTVLYSMMSDYDVWY